VKVDFSKYLSFKSSFGFLYSDITKEFFQKSWAQSEAAIDGAAFAQLSTKAILGSTKRIDVSNENIFNYKRILKKHDLDIIGGFSTQYSNIATSSAQAGNFATDNISTLNAGTMQYMTSDIQEDPLLSVLMRINYAYANKYLLSVSNRADESGKFAPGNRWGYFPSISAGWRVSSEKFFPDNKYVNDVKIRASYGATGNNKIGNYKYFAAITPAYASLGSEASPGYQQTSLPNNLLGWERTFSTNLGVDLGLFNNKLKLSVEYYNSTTDQLLLDLPIVASTGYSTYTMNKGKVSNKGIEFEISMPIINKGKFKWTVTANGSANKNELIDFGGTDKQINQGDPKRANFYLTQVGQPLTQYFGYKVDSVVPIRNTNYWPIDVTSFHAFARDINKDGKITPEDRVVLGDPYPKFIWGLTTNFQYKQFDISLTFQGSVGAKVFNIDPYYLGSEYTTTGVSALNSQGYDSMTLSRKVIKTQTDIFIQDASFIALRNLNIGYTLSPKLAKKMKIQKVRFYMTASNLWYHFADNYTSLNPEADNAFPNDPLRKGYQRGGVPLARTITFGANFDF
jgi:TonB-dependent starch-binding outer membrane protein SusC